MKIKSIAIAATTFVLSTSVNAAVITGPIYNPDNNHTYYLLTTSSWSDAEAEAISLGGHLVTINDQAENDFVFNTFSEFANPSNPALWIGFNDIDVEGTWVWSSGAQVTYTNWTPGEPNNQGGNEDAAVINPPDAEWNDIEVWNTFPRGVVEIVPIPAAVWLFGSGLLGLIGFARRKTHS